MGLYLTRTFQKRYLKLPKNIRNQIESAIREIYSDPSAGKRLVGDLEGEFSYRIGNYRIIYCIDEKKDIWIETVGHRKDVYKTR